MGLKLVTPPATFPVTREQAKAHLREDSDDFNDQIDAFIDAATGEAEGFQGRALIDQTWDLYLDCWPDRCWEHHRRHHVHAIKIPKPPLIEVAGVFYLDSSGTEQTLDASMYTVDATSEPARIVLKSGAWPTLPHLPNAVRVRFRAGYLDQTVSPAEENVPGTTKVGILIIVGSLYANRESVVIGETVAEIPWTAERMLRRNKFDLSLA